MMASTFKPSYTSTAITNDFGCSGQEYRTREIGNQVQVFSGSDVIQLSQRHLLQNLGATSSAGQPWITTRPFALKSKPSLPPFPIVARKANLQRLERYHSTRHQRASRHQRFHDSRTMMHRSKRCQTGLSLDWHFPLLSVRAGIGYHCSFLPPILPCTVYGAELI